MIHKHVEILNLLAASSRTSVCRLCASGSTEGVLDLFGVLSSLTTTWITQHSTHVVLCLFLSSLSLSHLHPLQFSPCMSCCLSLLCSSLQLPLRITRTCTRHLVTTHAYIHTYTYTQRRYSTSSSEDEIDVKENKNKVWGVFGLGNYGKQYVGKW
jgi:hypothetical protein